MHDEELGAGRVGVHGTSHGEYAAGVLQVVLDTVCSEFALDVPAGTAHAGTVRTAALNHKSRNHAVKNQSVIKALLYQLFKVFTGNRCNFRIQFDLNLLAVCHFNDYHGFFLTKSDISGALVHCNSVCSFQRQPCQIISAAVHGVPPDHFYCTTNAEKLQGQHRTKLVRKVRCQIFRQIA